MEENKTPSFKGLLSYVSRLKKAWTVAVYDPQSKKRAVADTLPHAIEKLNKETGSPVSSEVIVLDHKIAAQLTEEETKKKN